MNNKSFLVLGLLLFVNFSYTTAKDASEKNKKQVREIILTSLSKECPLFVRSVGIKKALVMLVPAVGSFLAGLSLFIDGDYGAVAKWDRYLYEVFHET